MNKHSSLLRLFSLITILMLAALACNLPGSATPTPDEWTVIQTGVVQTLTAQASGGLPGENPTDVPPNDFATSTPIVLATPTDTPLPATATNAIQPTAFSLCDHAQFVADVTIPDNTTFKPDVKFTKTWRLKNIGTCTWSTNYKLVFVSGDRMSAPAEVKFQGSVAPGQSVDISVDMRSPQKVDLFRGEWKLQNASGQKFGIGGGAASNFWVQIIVLPKANSNFALDFAGDFCEADWETGKGDISCPTSPSTNGYVEYTTAVKLENRTEDEPTLITHPDTTGNEFIQGTYPSYTVKDKDYFVAWIGCLDNSNGCKVTFLLQYINPNGVLKTFATWDEKYDGSITELNVDLSSLAGKKVNFILRVENDGGTDTAANAFWFVPRIQNKPSTPTPTFTPTPTLTPTPAPPPVPVQDGPESPPSIVCPGGLTVDLQWQAVTHPVTIDYYEWEAEYWDGGAWQPHPTTPTGQVPDPGLTVTIDVVCGTDYRWRVRAVDTDGLMSAYSSDMNFTIFP